MTNVVPIRRVTGSSDLPLTVEGQQNAKEMAESYSEPFDHVFCSPEQRSIDTAKKFGKVIVIKGLDAWYRGAYEAQPAKLMESAMRNLILNPTVKPPGRSPISGMPGESYLAFWKPLGHVMRTLVAQVKPEERFLIVTSGGNLQAISELAPDNFPQTLSEKELKKIASRPYWSEVGTLFKLSGDGLKPVTDNKQHGIYAMEHQETAFNSGKRDLRG